MDTGLALGWTVCKAAAFTGWEDESIVCVESGWMEWFSRASIALYVVLACQVGEMKSRYDKHRDAFIAAHQAGLVQYSDM